MDRNFTTPTRIATGCVSLSARRAWIEMFSNPGSTTLTFVALRKESVDRNRAVQNPQIDKHESLSARRAWIEMGFVDPDADTLTGRSPQGERG